MWPFKPIVTWHRSEDAYKPFRATKGAMAYDIFAPTNAVVEPGEALLLNTLVAVTLPKGYAMILGSRSGLASKHKITVEAGWIDNDYRGMIKVLLYNHSKERYAICKGDRIAQGMLVKVHNVNDRVSNSYPDTGTTTRGAGGFGSTGK